MRQRNKAFDAIGDALRDDQLSQADCRVYWFLLSRARGYTSRPSHARIAEASGLHQASISRCIRRLVAAGYVTVSPTDGNETNIYTLQKTAPPLNQTVDPTLNQTVDPTLNQTVDPTLNHSAITLP